MIFLCGLSRFDFVIKQERVRAGRGGGGGTKRKQNKNTEHMKSARHARTERKRTEKNGTERKNGTEKNGNKKERNRKERNRKNRKKRKKRNVRISRVPLTVRSGSVTVFEPGGTVDVKRDASSEDSGFPPRALCMRRAHAHVRVRKSPEAEEDAHTSQPAPTRASKQKSQGKRTAC